MTVTLREITCDTLREIFRLKVKPEQQKFVASNAVSIAQAHFHQAAWIRAIYADDTPVGFIIHCPGTAEKANSEQGQHFRLVSRDCNYEFARYKESDGWKRKY